VIWDIIHPLEQEEDISTTYEAIKEYLVHVHIKDGVPWEDKDMANWRYTSLMEGIVPIEKVVKLLVEKGYCGYYSLEWESLWRPEIRGERYTGEKIIPLYGKMMKNMLC
jgi:sugar phosphate isomerase/epimerase